MNHARSIVAGLALVLLAGCGGKGVESHPVSPGIVASTSSLQTAEGGARVSFTVQLATAPATDPVAVTVRSLDTTEGTLTTSSTATLGSSYVTLMFTMADWSSPGRSTCCRITTSRATGTSPTRSTSR